MDNLKGQKYSYLLGLHDKELQKCYQQNNSTCNMFSPQVRPAVV